MHLGSVWFLVTSHLQESLLTQFLQQVPHIFTNVVGYAVFVLDDLLQFIWYGLARLVGVLLHFANRFPRRFLGLRLHTKQLGQYTMRSLGEIRYLLGRGIQIAFIRLLALRAGHTEKVNISLLLGIMRRQMFQTSRQIFLADLGAFHDALIYQEFHHMGTQVCFQTSQEILGSPPLGR